MLIFNSASKYEYGFRKGYSSQQCLLGLLEKWKAAVDKSKVFGASLTDFSNAFVCVNHELLRQVPVLNLSAFSSEEGLTVDYCS